MKIQCALTLEIKINIRNGIENSLTMLLKMTVVTDEYM